MRGRLPTPTKILEARGSWRAKTRKNEPKPRADKPDPPADLTPGERTIWVKLTEQLHAVGCITVNDGWQIQRYCTFFVNWLRCRDRIARDGMLLPVKSDDPTNYMHKPKDGKAAIVEFAEHPLLREFHRLDKALKQIEREFGLTPTARVRLQSIGEPVQDEDPVTLLLRKSS